MADGLCTEDGTYKKKQENNKRIIMLSNNLVRNVGEKKNNCVSNVASDQKMIIVKCNNDKSSNIISESIICSDKSFYIDSDSGQLCSKFTSNNGGCVQNETTTLNASSPVVISASAGPTTIITDGGVVMPSPPLMCADSPCSSSNDLHDDCRKKRCADRYDSSESSDSGVAQLSCTDCSACSNSSTASSDITDPGSPYSTSSSHGEDSTPGPISSTTTNIIRSSTQQLIQTRNSKITQSEIKVENKMPPHESNCQSPPPESTPSPARQPWPWDVNKVPSKNVKNNDRCSDSERASPPNLLKRVTASKNTHTTSKRLKIIAEKNNKQKSIQNTNEVKQLNLTNNTRKILGKSIATLCPILPKPGPFQNLLCTSISPTLPTSNASPRTHAAPSRCTKNYTPNNNMSATLLTTNTVHNNPKVQSQSIREGPITKIISKARGGNNTSGVVNSTEYVSNLLTGTPQQQGKITEYFKAQIKPPAINTMKKDTVVVKTNSSKTKTKRITKNSVANNKIELVKNQTSGDLKKYLGLLSGSLNDKAFYVNGECDNLSVTPSELYRKIDVRTLSFQNHMQAVKMDLNQTVKMDTKLNGKVNPVVSLTRKILPKPSSQTTFKQKKVSEIVPNGMKLATLRLHDVKSTLKPTTSTMDKITPNKINKNGTKSTSSSSSSSLSSVMPIVIPTNINTALPTVVTPKLGMNNSMQTVATTTALTCPPLVKLNGSFIPIVKLNPVNAVIQSSPIVTDTKIYTNNLQSLRIETGVPTVPLLKHVSENEAHKQLLSSPKSVVLETMQQKKSKALENNVITANELPCKAEHNISNGITSITALDKNISLLHVTVNSSITTTTNNYQIIESQKSPILSQPKTIRFPPRQIDTNREERRLDGQCQWSECHAKFETSGALLEHLQIAHVISQATKENFVCLWIGCKVHGRTSCSRSWLERHVLSHAGNKPYRCIVDGCGCRFNSQTALERHVNSHFNADGAPNLNNQRRSLENGSSKLTRKNGKKIRYRLQPWSARMFDYFDSGIMEGLQHRLINMTDARTGGKIAGTPGNVVTLRSTVLARRTELNGNKSVLLRWHPENVIPDEWIAESEVTPLKHVPIPGLEPSAINVLHTELFTTTCKSTSLRSTSQDTTTPDRPRNRRKRVSTAINYSNRLVT